MELMREFKAVRDLPPAKDPFQGRLARSIMEGVEAACAIPVTAEDSGTDLYTDGPS